jgi:hypothetical protein
MPITVVMTDPKSPGANGKKWQWFLEIGNDRGVKNEVATIGIKRQQ